MYLIAICVVGLAVLIFGIVRMMQMRRHREVEKYAIEPEELHDLILANKDVMILDVRQPLDLLAHSEIIPGSRRVSPKEVIAEAQLIPKDKDAVLYCTCVSEKTSKMILEKALGLQFTRIKFLKGGLAAWKAKGFPVERYETPFHLDTAK